MVSVLEGGYSDRALTSGSMGHVVGMASANWAAGPGAGRAQREEPASVLGEELAGKEEWYADEELALVRVCLPSPRS